MDILTTLPIDDWNAAPSDAIRHMAIDALESGAVIYLPKLAFVLRPDERILLSAGFSDGRAKNVSLDPSGRLKHASGPDQQLALLQGMMQRYAQCAVSLIETLFPRYRGLERARTSYRPVQIAGRASSVLQDDTRLHVDAFPTRPLHGRRILRLFSNINPSGEPRVWNIGEPFKDMATRFAPRVAAPPAIKSWLLAAVGATQGRRGAYDNLMLGLHDAAKLDQSYQSDGEKQEFRFPAGTSWLCFTDQVMHAALSGQFALEQTFHLDVEAMAAPERAPIHVLEQVTGRALA